MEAPHTPQRITNDASRKSSQNFHPYMIQSTSSSLLTRSNSSPTQPVDSYTRHRPSRSMSSLSAQAIVTSGEESEDRRKSLEARPSQLRRSGTLPAFPPSPSDLKKQITLPANPKQWTPSELATYLVHTLTTGGETGDGHTLPPVLVEDIRSWVLRQQVNGRTFLRGGDQGWGSSQRPPPFLPLLLSLSRKLRRANLQGRILTMPREPSFASSNGSEGASGIYEYGAADRDFVLLEETENASDDDDAGLDDEDQVLGVKKLVKDFDMRGSASEASGDEAPPPRRGSFTTEWRKDHNVTGRRRKDSSLSAGGMADGEMSPIIRPARPAEIADVKARQTLVKEESNPSESSGSVNTSPPPPYASPNLGSAEQQASPLRVPTNPQLLSADSSPALRERISPSPTPTPPRPKLSTCQSSPPNDLSAPEGSPHMAHMQSHERSGSNPYFALRRSASGSAPGQGPRLPTLASLRENAEMARGDKAEMTDSEDERRRLTPSKGAQAWDLGHTEGEDARWTTARRVTLRPNAAKGLFEASGSASSPEAARSAGGSKRERKLKDEDMERKMGLLLARIHELEERLHSVEAEKALNAQKPSTSSLLTHFGLGGNNDGLPSSLKGLPAYLFLVGIGVGVVVVKVLLGRKR